MATPPKITPTSSSKCPPIPSFRATGTPRRNACCWYRESFTSPMTGTRLRCSSLAPMRTAPPSCRTKRNARRLARASCSSHLSHQWTQWRTRTHQRNDIAAQPGAPLHSTLGQYATKHWMVVGNLFRHSVRHYDRPRPALRGRLEALRKSKNGHCHDGSRTTTTFFRN